METASLRLVSDLDKKFGADGGRVWMMSSQTPPPIQPAGLSTMVVGDSDYGQMNYGNILSTVPEHQQ